VQYSEDLLQKNTSPKYPKYGDLVKLKPSYWKFMKDNFNKEPLNYRVKTGTFMVMRSPCENGSILLQKFNKILTPKGNVASVPLWAVEQTSLKDFLYSHYNKTDMFYIVHYNEFTKTPYHYWEQSGCGYTMYKHEAGKFTINEVNELLSRFSPEHYRIELIK
jgi:hypothetical protein